MSGENPANHKGTNGDPTTETAVQQAQTLWDEYRYRHDLVWRVIFQITTAAVILSVVPYLAPMPVIYYLEQKILAAPILASILVLFSLFVLWDELILLGKMRTAHRFLQNSLFENLHKLPPGVQQAGDVRKVGWTYLLSDFGISTLVYFVALLGVSSVNVLFLAIYWIPNCVYWPSFCGSS